MNHNNLNLDGITANSTGAAYEFLRQASRQIPPDGLLRARMGGILTADP